VRFVQDFVGCSFVEACEWLREESASIPTGRSQIVHVYSYCDVNGRTLYQNCRYYPKDFRIRRPDGHGGWIWSLGDVVRVPYRLPDLSGHKTVVIAEGERDVERLWQEGVAATTNVLGAGKWHDTYSKTLADVRVEEVWVIPDADPAGRSHAQQVAHSCAAAGLAVRVVELPGVPEKGDVSDWLDGGHSVKDLKTMCQECGQHQVDFIRRDSERIFKHGARMIEVTSKLFQPQD